MAPSHVQSPRPAFLPHLELYEMPAQNAAAPHGCATCGGGIPDARLSPRVSLGADTFADRLRLYVKMGRAARQTQLSVDVGQGSAVVMYGLRF